MASKRATHAKPASSTHKAGSSGPPESGKPGPGHSRVLVKRRHPSMLHMVLEALQTREQKRGLSVVAIKVYILQTYPLVDLTRFKYLLKQALDTGMRRGLLTRPVNSKAKGATGSFKLVPEKKRPAQLRKTAAPEGPGKAGEAQEKAPNKPRRANKTPGNSGQVDKAARNLAEVEEALWGPGTGRPRAPKKGHRTEDVQAKPGQAKKVPPKPGKAAQTPSGASGGGGAESKVKVNKSRQGNAETHGKTEADIQSPKPAANQVENGTASPPKRKLAAKPLKGKAAAQGTREGPRAEAVAPAKGEKAQPVPAHLAGKTEAPKKSTAPAKTPPNRSNKTKART